MNPASPSRRRASPAPTGRESGRTDGQRWTRSLGRVRRALLLLALGALPALVASPSTYAEPTAATSRIQAGSDSGAQKTRPLPWQAAYKTELGDDALLVAMIAAVVGHDLGIPIGFLPFPATQYAGETIQYVGNLGLKAFRPWLQPPPDVNRYPADDGDGDQCHYNFYLPSTTAEYENLYGFIPLNRLVPLYDGDRDRFYVWNDRFGPLGPPRIYHANSSARLSVRSVEPVQPLVPALNAPADSTFPPLICPDDGDCYFPPYYPIPDAFNPVAGTPTILGRLQPARADRDGVLAHDGPIHVVLPVGEHELEWTAATQFNTLTDVVVPGALLLFGVLSEVGKGSDGLSAARKVADNDLTEDVANQAGNLGEAAASARSKSRFKRVWEHFWTQPADQSGPIGREVRKAAGKWVEELALEAVDRAVGVGLTVLEAETIDAFLANGRLSERDGKILKVVYAASVNLRIETSMDVIKAALLEDDNEDFLAAIIVTFLQTFGLDQFLAFDTGVTDRRQTFVVWDNVPPTITIDPTPLILEATDIGGARRYRAIDAMRAAVEPGASDNCGRTPILESDAPELLPLGRTRVTWTARDRGPNPPNDGQDYAPTAVQIVRVVDTQPPLLLPPPSKVIEDTAAVPLVTAEIGDAVAVDLADTRPEIRNNAPSSFPLDSRTKVRWTATDGSGNAAKALQWITVKTEGTNTAPIAQDRSAQTLTSKPVNIRLRATDADVLDGRPDPLWFKIERRPRHGEFVAPLLPFFINDYRTGAQDGLGDDFDPADPDVRGYVTRTYCEQGLEPPVEFVHEASHVHVTDEGIRYVLDHYFACSSEDRAVTLSRFSKWGPDREFLGQIRLETNPDGDSPDDLPFDDAFVIDRDGSLYYNTAIEPGTSSMRLDVIKCETDFTRNGSPNPDKSTECGRSYDFTSSSVPDNGLYARSMSYARVDSRRNVIYLADAQSIFAFEPLESGGTRYLGELGPKRDGAVIEDWLGRVPTLEVGSDGSLYVADEQHHRIHKIDPVVRHRDGTVSLGDYVGWAGRCTGSGNKACDEEAGRSRGYSCTFEDDSCTPTLAELSGGTADARGAGQGQFDTPRYIAIDPNDVLYIADYGNERVQRLSRDGSFAGEAVSEGSGINKGDRPSFVLGNMGKPESLSVNSSQFFVVDKDEGFLHVFGTLPFKNITDDAVTVTYVSDTDFHGDSDTFRYSAGDGLADSDLATVRIRVDRNHRPPIALAGEAETDEDTPVAITLTGDDPDGIAGRDFNGLDTLSFQVTKKPRSGRLTGDGASWTYTPDPDFYGDDRIRFTVDDGMFTSPEATVTITVRPVNDPPVVSLEPPARAARGFPVMLNAAFTDDPPGATHDVDPDDPNQGYEAVLAWGDGRVDVTGGIVTDEDSGDPRIEGVAVFPPPLPEAEGRISATHTWDTAGVRTVRLCLLDVGNAEDCDVAQVSVEDLVSLGVGPSVLVPGTANKRLIPKGIPDHKRFDYVLSVVNQQPSSGVGLTAEAVALDVRLASDVDFLQAGAVDPGTGAEIGSCTRTGRRVRCEFGALAPDDEAEVTIRVRGPGDLVFDEDRELRGQLTTTSPSLEESVEVYVSVNLLADPTDSDEDGVTDVYERAYGLRVNVADGDRDLDGDGLSNREEFEARTAANDADTDGDGLSDYQELRRRFTDPLDPDSDGDGLPDGWEAQLRLDPNDPSDARGDLDRDGYTNLEEYEAGTDARDPNANPGVSAAVELIMDIMLRDGSTNGGVGK